MCDNMPEIHTASAFQLLAGATFIVGRTRRFVLAAEVLLSWGIYDCLLYTAIEINRRKLSLGELRYDEKANSIPDSCERQQKIRRGSDNREARIVACEMPFMVK